MLECECEEEVGVQRPQQLVSDIGATVSHMHVLPRGEARGDALVRHRALFELSSFKTPGIIPVATLPAILRVRRLEGTLSSCVNGRFVVLSLSW